ncbi:MAG: hypothetical protein ACYCO4_04155 [Sulfobacillus sp.]
MTTVDRWLATRPVLALASVLLAVAVWAVVISQSDPIVHRTLSGVPVVVIGGPAGAKATPGTVTVVVQGPQSLLQAVASAQFRVTAVDPGSQGGLAPLVLSGPGGTALVEFEPAQVRIRP